MPDKLPSWDSFIPKQISNTLSSLGKLVSTPFGSGFQHRTAARTRLSNSPGIENTVGVDQSPELGTIIFQCIDYGATGFEKKNFDTIEQLIAYPRPDWSDHRWVNVEGLHPYVINELRKTYDFHTLAAEDALNANQRPKMEPYEGHSLVVVKMPRIEDETLVSEQVSFIVMNDLLITFQEKQGDVWNPVRKRIQKSGSRFRKYSIWYLVYGLIDAVIDNVFPILEQYGDALNVLEEQAMTDPKPSIQQGIYIIKRELFGLRRAMWPMRELAGKLTFDETSPVDENVKTYMRDAQNHAVQIIDLIESCREMANGLQDFYISIVSNRMNEVMKALTIMASLFMPITFLAGMYGMNFEFIPELGWKYAYPTFLTCCVICVTGLLWYFKRKRWI